MRTSNATVEVLRALVLGLELREYDGAWRFVGPFQPPERSGVPLAVMQELFDAGYVCSRDRRAELTDAGSAELERHFDSAMEILKCPPDLKIAAVPPSKPLASKI
jgi:hypothetical protein